MLQCPQEHGSTYQLCPVRYYLLLFLKVVDGGIRSTTLDSWQLSQLRSMKVAGNASAVEFFSKHGGSSLLSDSDSKKKYSCRVAQLYKEELARRVKDDIARYVQLAVASTLIPFPTQIPEWDRRRWGRRSCYTRCEGRE